MEMHTRCAQHIYNPERITYLNEVMKRGNKKWVRGINITVSPKAHALLTKEAFLCKPRRTLREHINIVNNLPAGT